MWVEIERNIWKELMWEQLTLDLQFDIIGENTNRKVNNEH